MGPGQEKDADKYKLGHNKDGGRQHSEVKGDKYGFCPGKLGIFSNGQRRTGQTDNAAQRQKVGNRICWPVEE